tara:strand:+ start:11364 stop:11570 length:207 start_codon:yes stop_codon:yes gene_type:complete
VVGVDKHAQQETHVVVDNAHQHATTRPIVVLAFKAVGEKHVVTVNVLKRNHHVNTVGDVAKYAREIVV